MSSFISESNFNRIVMSYVHYQEWAYRHLGKTDKSSFLLVAFIRCGLYLDKLLSLGADKRGWLNPPPQTWDHWIPCGHPGATLPVPSQPKVSRNKRCNSTLTRGHQHWHTWDLCGRHGLAQKTHWKCTRRNKLPRICPSVEIEFPTFFRGAATQNVNHYPPKFLFPAKAPPFPPNEGTWGLCSMCGHHHPSPSLSTAPLGGGMRGCHHQWKCFSGHKRMQCIQQRFPAWNIHQEMQICEISRIGCSVCALQRKFQHTLNNLGWKACSVTYGVAGHVRGEIRGGEVFSSCGHTREKQARPLGRVTPYLGWGVATSRGANTPSA